MKLLKVILILAGIAITSAGDKGNFRRRPGLRAKRRACSRVALKTRGRRTRQSNRCMRKLTSELDDINIVVVRGGSRRNTVKTVRIDADVDCDRAFIRRQIRKARKARRECLKELFDSDSDSSSSSEDKKKKRSTKGSEDDKKKKKKKLITTSSPDDRRYLKKGKSAEEEGEEEASLKSRKGPKSKGEESEGSLKSRKGEGSGSKSKGGSKSRSASGSEDSESGSGSEDSESGSGSESRSGSGSGSFSGDEDSSSGSSSGDYYY